MIIAFLSTFRFRYYLAATEGKKVDKWNKLIYKTLKKR